MKKVIDGVKYDTEADNVEHIESWNNGYGAGDFNHCYEDLYRTDNGNWFIHGRGGPRSKYSKARGNARCGTKTIVVMTEDEAYQWLEEHDKISTIEKMFADRIEAA